MAHAATFNDALYEALRASEMEERHAMRAARAVPRVGDVEGVKSAVIRIDETLTHMDKRIDVVEEKIGSIRTLLFAVYTPLLLLILASQFGVIGLLVRLLTGAGQ